MCHVPVIQKAYIICNKYVIKHRVYQMALSAMEKQVAEGMWGSLCSVQGRLQGK